MKNKNFQRQRYILIGWFALLFLLLFFLMLQLMEQKDGAQTIEVLRQTLVSFPFLMLLAFLDYRVIKYISSKPYFKDRFAQRVMLELFVGSLLSVALVVVGNLAIQGTIVFEDFVDKYLLNVPVIAASFINFLMVFMLEFFFQYDQQRKKELEIIELKSENTEYLYNQLRSQINPHFLFNSLNVLTALINKSGHDAVLYTRKLSNIYRYVLNHDRQELITVKKEIDFAENYIEVLRTRFGNHLKFKVELSEEEQSRQIPPMTLQLLIENAVKHNTVSQSKKLCVRLYTENNCLCIGNNKNQLNGEIAQTGIGLKNLNSRLKLLGNSGIHIVESDEAFTVKVPLL